MIEVRIPIKIESEANLRDHWAARKKRFDAQRKEIFWELRPLWRRKKIPPPLVVTLVRIGPRQLDSDNLAGGFKAVRDEIADLIGIDDGDSLIEWRYGQERGKSKEYAIRVQIEAA